MHRGWETPSPTVAVGRSGERLTGPTQSGAAVWRGGRQRRADRSAESPARRSLTRTPPFFQSAEPSSIIGHRRRVGNEARDGAHTPQGVLDMSVGAMLGTRVQSWAVWAVMLLGAVPLCQGAVTAQDGADYIVKMRIVTFYPAADGAPELPSFAQGDIYKEAEKQPDGHFRIPPIKKLDGARSDLEVEKQLHKLDPRFKFRVVGSASARTLADHKLDLVAQSAYLNDLARKAIYFTCQFEGSLGLVDAEGWSLLTVDEWKLRYRGTGRSVKEPACWLKLGGTYRWLGAGRPDKPWLRADGKIISLPPGALVLLTILDVSEYE